MGYVDRVPTQYRFLNIYILESLPSNSRWVSLPIGEKGGHKRESKRRKKRRRKGREGRALVGVTAPANGRGGGNVLRGKKRRRRVDDEKEEVTSVPPSPSPHIPDWGFRTPRAAFAAYNPPEGVNTPQGGRRRRDGRKRGIDRFGEMTDDGR